MSVKIMGLVWERAPYSEGSLLVLLALADWSNDEGESWPGMAALAQKARLHERQARRILRVIEKDGIVTTKRGGGRAHQNSYRINTDILSAFPPAMARKEKGTLETQTRTLETEKGSSSTPDPSVKRSVSKKTDPSEGADAPASTKKQKSKPYPNRSEWPKHIAIFFAITNHAPLQQLWPLVEQRLGTEPDVAKLRECYLAWIGRGYNARAVTWLDWYRDEIPARPTAPGGQTKEPKPAAIFTRPRNWREMGLKVGDPHYKWLPEDAI